MNRPQGICVAFDAKRAFANNTGLGNYSRLVIASMAALYPANDYLLFTPRAVDNRRMDSILMRENISTVTPQGLGRHCPALWRSTAIPAGCARAGVDIYHGLSNEIPLVSMPCPSVVTIHDLIWRRIPGDYSPIDRRLYDLKYGHAARHATRIIAISDRTRSDIVKDWNIDPAKIDVVYQGVDPIFATAPDYDSRQTVRKRYGISGRYIITVGSIQSRKNQLLAIRGLQALDRDISLVIVGRGRGDYAGLLRSEISRLRLDDRVIHIGNVDFNDLPALYAGAVFSSYTSRYEGFGLPVVESLTVGTPVIACTGSCLEEAGGAGALYVGPDDTGAWVEAARAIIDKPWMRDRLADAGRRHIRQFNHADFATGIMKSYNKAILDFNLKNL